MTKWIVRSSVATAIAWYLTAYVLPVAVLAGSNCK
jgi:hypothetical protein